MATIWGPQMFKNLKAGPGIKLTQEGQDATQIEVKLADDAPGLEFDEEGGLKLTDDNNADLLRQELADPESGAHIVYMLDPEGVTKSVDEIIKETNQEYAVTAFNTSAGGLQTGPLIVNAGNKLRLTGVQADAAYNFNVLQDIFAGLPSGAEVELPSRGLVYCNAGLVIDAPGVSIRGRSATFNYGALVVQFVNASNVPALTLTNSGFHMRGVGFRGNGGTEAYGTFDLFDFAPIGHKNCDAQIADVGALFFRDLATVQTRHARNIRFDNFNFSNSRRAFSYELPGDYPSSGDYNLGYEFYNCRYHSIGQVPDVNACVFYVNPESNVSHMVIDGGLADSSFDFFRGFAGGLDIKNISGRLTRGSVAILDATLSAINLDRRDVNIENCSSYRTNLASNAQSLIKSAGNFPLNVSNFVGVGAAGHGIEIRSRNATISNCRIENASAAQHQTYSAFYVGAEAENTVFGSGNVYRQDRQITSANKANFGVSNAGTGTVFMDAVFVDNLVGREYYVDPTKQSYGPDPRGLIRSPRVIVGAPPGSGVFKNGDLALNLDPNATSGGKAISHKIRLDGIWRDVVVA